MKSPDEGRGASTTQNDTLRESFCSAQYDKKMETCVQKTDFSSSLNEITTYSTPFPQQFRACYISFSTFRPHN